MEQRISVVGTLARRREEALRQWRRRGDRLLRPGKRSREIPDEETAHGHEEAGEDEERLEPVQVADAAGVVQERVQIGVEAIGEHDQGNERREPEGQQDRAARATRDEGGLFGPCSGRVFGLSHHRVPAGVAGSLSPWLLPP